MLRRLRATAVQLPASPRLINRNPMKPTFCHRYIFLPNNIPRQTVSGLIQRLPLQAGIISLLPRVLLTLQAVSQKQEIR